MEKEKGSNNEDRNISQPVNHEAMKETSKLQGKNPGDGREDTYKVENEEKEKGEEMTGAETASMKKDVTSNEEDVKKEFEIRSGKSGETGSEKSKDGMGSGKSEGVEKREKEPVAESDEDIGDDKDQGSGAGWQKSYKGDAELVP
jgi:hypothetical protein